MLTKFVGVHIIILFAVGTYFAYDAVTWQHQAITAFVPTQAVVLASKLVVHKGKNTRYTPDISYSFTFNGASYTSSRVLPFSEDGPSDWARQILIHYPVAGHVTAYVNPANPHESILWRVHSMSPYFLLNGALLGLSLGLGMLFGLVGIPRDTMSAVPIEGRHLLLPVSELRKSSRNAALVFLAFTITTLPVWAHFHLVAEQRDMWSLVLTAVAALLFLLLGFNAWRLWSVVRHVSDARLIVHPVPLKLGEPFEIHVEFDANQHLLVAAMTAKIVCIEHYYHKSKGKNAYGTRTYIERSIQLAGSQDVPAGQIITGGGQTTFDHSHPPSWDRGEKIYPYYTWEIRIALELIHLPDYKGVFPITVEK